MSSYWGKRSPPFALVTIDANGDPLWVVEGRSFTEHTLKRAIIAASGGYVSTFYFEWDEMVLWEILEAIEIAADLNKPEDDGIDVFTLLSDTQ